jgi:regulator of RNase E activity RraA
MYINGVTDNLRINGPWTRPDRTAMAELGTFPVAAIADHFDRMLVMNGNIVPLTSSDRLVGSALPIHTRGGDNLAIHRALDDAQPGDVLVINGQGDLNRALIGDLIAEIMVKKGVRGAVVDGAIRDAESIALMGLSVFGLGATPAGPFKNGPGSIGFPVAVGGLVVAAGDVIVADRDGVALVPAADLDRAIAGARRVLGAEEALRKRILDGVAHEA